MSNQDIGMQTGPNRSRFLLKFALWRLVAAGALAAGPAAAAPAGVFDDLPDIKPSVEVYKTAGGQRLNLYVYAPTNHNPKADIRPAILFIHGGGWSAGNPDQFALHCRYFAARGFVAMSVQYRLAKPPGVTVFNCIADVKSALRWARLHARDLGVATNRIAVAGDSAGGHLAACLGLIGGLDEPGEDVSVSARPDAMILYNPVTDTTPPDGWRYLDPAVKDRAREFSPVDHIAPGAPPTLVMHGTADKVVPCAWAERFVAAMRQAGNPVEFDRLEGKDHAFVIRGCGDDETILKALRRTHAFLRALGYLPPDGT